MHWSLHQFFMVFLWAAVVCRIDMLFAEHGWKSRWKIPVVLLVIFVSGFSDQRGWPARIDDIEKFTYISGVVEKPSAGNAGKIYIWVRLENNPKLPFAIELEYDDELAKRINVANLQSILHGEMSIDMRQFKEVKKTGKHEPTEI